jgi:hypothetical protein
MCSIYDEGLGRFVSTGRNAPTKEAASPLSPDSGYTRIACRPVMEITGSPHSKSDRRQEVKGRLFGEGLAARPGPVPTEATGIRVVHLEGETANKVHTMTAQRSSLAGRMRISTRIVARSTRQSQDYGELPPIFLMIDWISVAASFQAREISWLLELASFSLHLPTMPLSISR